MTNKLRIQKAQGFTLIETMVALLLLSTAIAAQLTIASKGLSTSVIAKDQIGAFNLAQDGMEYIRFVRDTNRLKGANWLTGAGGTSAGIDLSTCASAGATVSCYVDSVQSSVTSCTSNVCPLLSYDSTNHYYSYTTGNTSPQRYRRIITITTPVGSNADEAKVSVVVQWTAVGGATKSVTVQENMLNWQ